MLHTNLRCVIAESKGYTFEIKCINYNSAEKLIVVMKMTVPSQFPLLNLDFTPDKIPNYKYN